MLGRSQIHPVTNNVWFSFNKEANDWTKRFLKEKIELPPGFVFSFLHEATHHWCFSSSVGTRAALLDMEGKVLCGLGQESTNSKYVLNGIKKVALSGAFFELTRPLAEGMSLFSELDLRTKRLSTRNLTPPLRWMENFYNHGILDRASSNAFLNCELAKLRFFIGTTLLRKLEGLYAEPLSTVGNGGYLAGYLFIKNLWYRYRFLNEDYCDANLFLNFVYNCFYENADLLSALESRFPIEPSLTALAKAFWSLVTDCFFSPNLELKLKDFSRAYHSNDILHLQKPTGAITLDLEKLGCTPVCPDTHLVGNALQRVFQARDIIVLGKASCEITLEESKVHICSEELEWSGEGFELLSAGDLETQTFKGELQILVNLRGGELAFCIAPEPVFIPIAYREVLPETTSTDFDWRKALKGLEARALLNPLLNKLWQHHGVPPETSLVARAIHCTKMQLDNIYLPAAVFHASPDRYEEICSLMRDEGLYGFLDQSSDLVKVLAKLSLYSSNGIVLGDEQRNSISDLAIDELQKYSDEYGLFRFLVQKDFDEDTMTEPHVFCSI